MASKKNKQSTLKEKLSQISKLLAIGSPLIVGGYYAGVYRGEVQCILEKTSLQYDYNQKIQQQIDACKSLKREEYVLSSEELEALIKTLSKNEHGK